MDDAEQYRILKQEIVQLFEYVQKIKEEVASIKHPDMEDDHFTTVADQLNAVVVTTETATNTIMNATEVIVDAANEMSQMVKLQGAQDYFNRIKHQSGYIFEACAFQDITGQRISKVIDKMQMIEGTLNSLVVILGEDGMAGLPLKEKEAPDDVPMEGPQMEGEGVSQSDIDKLFD